MEFYDDPLQIEIEHPTRTLDLDTLTHLIYHVLEAEGFSLTYLGLVLSDHAAIHELNREYLGHDYETDVLSFPLQSPEQIAQTHTVEGEIYVDLDTAFEDAPDFHASYEQEAMRYVVHGLLHLMGYDDATDELRTQMRALEDRYLSACGI